MVKKRQLPTFLAAMLTLALAACASGEADEELTTSEPSTTAAGTALNVQLVEAPNLPLTAASYPQFTMDVPVGWTIETVGEYETFGFRLYDPAQPARQIFFYGKMHPLMKSYEGREAWQRYLDGGGYGGDSQIYAAAPVLQPASTAQFFAIFDEFTGFANANGIYHEFPAFPELEIVESAARGSLPGALDDSLLRVLFNADGLPSEGLVAASVFDAMENPLYGVDAGWYNVYVVSGITAPADEFIHLESQLAASLGSFRFSEAYIQQGVAQIKWETEVALEVGRVMAEAADSYNNAWWGRQQTYDTLSQKRSDATLGYDRLYDTATGETYRAELGFYEDYDINREKYGNPNLEKVPDDGYDLYGTPLSGYIYK